MKYPLHDMTLNEKECEIIIIPIIEFGLTKDKISSTLHTAVRYGPCSLEIIENFDLSVIQV